jgi:hypothetical protein
VLNGGAEVQGAGGTGEEEVQVQLQRCWCRGIGTSSTELQVLEC